jgi:alpha-glucosidase
VYGTTRAYGLQPRSPRTPTGPGPSRRRSGSGTVSRVNPTDIPAPAPAPDRTAAGARPWWRSAVIYQAYIRSLADGNGDGIGDIAGLRSRLDYLVDLGIDAVWINPWYPSPMADAGYDVADYRAIEPLFGTLAEAETLIGEAHRLGLRILLDIVPNHTSDHHQWFVEALASAPGSPARGRYIFRDGRGVGGKAPPNDWPSQFGGSAWTQVTTADGKSGQWYLHLFAPGQPDLDWTNPEVRAEFLDILRFWFDRGVDGFRIDVAHGLAKDMALGDVGAQVWPPTGPETVVHPFWDRDDVHEIYREWRRLADSYAEPRVFVGEAWVTSPVRLAHYVRPDELNTTFNFDFLLTPWVAASLQASIRSTLASHLAVGAPPTWVLSNHDVAREVSRYARPQGDRILRHLDDLIGLPADFDLGRRRARAAALLMLALPGSAYIYQGEELGLAEVEDLPDDVLQDPTFFQSGRTSRGRDGARVPIPWAGRQPPFGFSPPDASAPPWLPQPRAWAAFTVEAESGAGGSVLELYRAALRLRRREPALGDGGLEWGDAPDGALSFARDPDFACVVNVDAVAVPLPAGASVLLASGPLAADGSLPAATTVWLRPSR